MKIGEYIAIINPPIMTPINTIIIGSINDERLSIVGDCNLILKDEHLLHSMGLIDEKYWKKYE